MIVTNRRMPINVQTKVAKLVYRQGFFVIERAGTAYGQIKKTMF